MIFTLNQIVAFTLILSRLSGILFSGPFFSRKEINGMVRMALAFWTSALLIFVIPLPDQLPSSNIGLALAIVIEVLIGAMIGFVTDLLISAIEFAGTLMDTQAGLSVASLLDPSSGRTITIISQFLKLVATMIFVLIDGHHIVLTAFVESLKLLPIGGTPNFSKGAFYVMGLGKDIFEIGLRLSAPILLIVFLIDFAFGMLSRVAPQVNVFQLGFQIKPLVSIFIFLAIIPGLLGSITGILEGITQHLLNFFLMMQT